MDSKDLLRLKWWLDAEISINHAYYWAILGAIIGGKFWWIAGPGIAISIIYALRRSSRLPRDYLKLPKEKNNGRN